MKVLKPVEIGYFCHDIDAMVRFYTEGLGLPLIRGPVFHPGIDRQLYALACGETVLKLWGYDPSPSGRIPPPKGPNAREDQAGVRYLTVFVEADIDAICDRIVAEGFTVNERGRRGRFSPAIVAFVQDPDGNWIELIRPDDLSWDPNRPLNADSAIPMTEKAHECEQQLL